MTAKPRPRKREQRHPFAQLLAQYRQRKPGLTQTRLAELAGYDQAILVRMCQGKKDLTGPSGRERVVRLIEILANQGALSSMDEANALLLAASMPPLFEPQPVEAQIIQRLSRIGDRPGHHTRRTNLPAQVTNFIGRAQEVVEIRRLLNETRLLTLTGAGGCGKTRLAQQVAADVLIRYINGVWYAELAALTQPHQIVETVARIFGLSVAERDAFEQLAEFLRDRHVLLVLDNCEHLIDAAASCVLMLLRACPRLTILTTSREALNIDAETTWRVPPMHIDEATHLFVYRASVARSDLQLSNSDAKVRDICQRLDGMPLAIELAASRLHGLSLDDIVARLGDRFNLLSGGRRGAIPRHQTLRALIEWSYELLNEPERILLRRLAVFVGGWTLEMAELIVSEEANGVGKSESSLAKLQRADVMPLLLQLVSKSLVVLDSVAGETRYYYLETIRQFGHTQLIAHGEHEMMGRRHAEAYRQLAWRSEQALRSREQGVWLQKLDQDFSNFQTAVAWSFETGHDAELGNSIVAGLTFFLIIAMTRLADAQRWSRLALSHMQPDTPAKTRGNLLLLPAWVDTLSLAQVINANRAALQCFEEAGDIINLAWAAGNLGRFLLKRDPLSEEGQRYLDEALILAKHSQHEWTIGTVEVGAHANSAYEKNDFAWAEALYRNGVVQAKQRNNLDSTTVISHILATVLMQQLKFEDAIPFLEDSYNAACQINDPLYRVFTQAHRARATAYLGDLVAAKALAEVALSEAREQLPERHRKLALLTLSRIQNETGAYAEAQSLAQEALNITQRHVSMTPGWYCAILDVLACIASGADNALLAARLFGAAETDYESVHLAAVMLEAHQLDAFNGHRAIYNEHSNAPYIAKAKTVLGEGAYQSAFVQGQALTTEQAVTLALSFL